MGSGGFEFKGIRNGDGVRRVRVAYGGLNPENLGTGPTSVKRSLRKAVQVRRSHSSYMESGHDGSDRNSKVH
jgi:hypothetical protein